MIKTIDLIKVPEGMAANSIALLFLEYFSVITLSTVFVAKMAVIFIILAIPLALYSIKYSLIFIGYGLHALLVSALVHAGFISIDLRTLLFSALIFTAISIMLSMLFDRQGEPNS